MSGVRCVGNPEAHVCREGTSVCVCKYGAMYCGGGGVVVPVKGAVCQGWGTVSADPLCLRGLGVTV